MVGLDSLNGFSSSHQIIYFNRRFHIFVAFELGLCFDNNRTFYNSVYVEDSLQVEYIHTQTSEIMFMHKHKAQRLDSDFSLQLKYEKVFFIRFCRVREYLLYFSNHQVISPSQNKVLLSFFLGGFFFCFLFSFNKCYTRNCFRVIVWQGNEFCRCWLISSSYFMHLNNRLAC